MLVIAHRGASAAHPENTVAAFEGAVALRADGVELDVRRTAGGVPVVCHDERLPDGRALLELAVDDLPPTVPHLDAALDACAPLGFVNVEIKNWPDDGDFDDQAGLADAVVAVLAARGELDDGRRLVSCFHLPTADRVRALAPGLRTAWLRTVVTDPARLVETTVRHGHGAIHPHHLAVSADLVRRAHDAGLRVHVWTCDDPERIRWLAGIGVDGVITDATDLALAALGR